MQQDSREKAKRAWILVLAAMASFMVSLDALVVATAVLATLGYPFEKAVA